MNVVVYRSKRMADTYIYLAAGGDIEELPEQLLSKFAQPEAFLELELHAERHLQQADPRKVMAAISAQGFYLQLPPQEQDDVLGN